MSGKLMSSPWCGGGQCAIPEGSKSQPGRFGTHKSWESDSPSESGVGGMEGPSPPRRRRVSSLEEAAPQAALVWMPSAGSCVVPTGQVSDRMEGFESRTKCPLSFPEEPYLKPCWGAGSWTGQRCWSRNVGFPWAKWQWLAEVTQLQPLTGGHRKWGKGCVPWLGAGGRGPLAFTVSVQSLCALLSVLVW